MGYLRTNAKLDKTYRPAAAYLIAWFTAAPHSLSGHQVRPGRSVGCAASCNLWFAGQRVTPASRNRAILDTQLLFTDRPAFLAQLDKDIALHVWRAEQAQLVPLIRLNVAMVFDTPYHPQSGRIGPLPKTAQIHGCTYRVIDGDKHDCRLPIVDSTGVVIGLRLKGTNAAKARARQNGFATR